MGLACGSRVFYSNTAVSFPSLMLAESNLLPPPNPQDLIWTSEFLLEAECGLLPRLPSPLASPSPVVFWDPRLLGKMWAGNLFLVDFQELCSSAFFISFTIYFQGSPGPVGPRGDIGRPGFGGRKVNIISCWFQIQGTKAATFSLELCENSSHAQPTCIPPVCSLSPPEQRIPCSSFLGGCPYYKER